MAPALSVPWGSGDAGSTVIGDLSVVSTLTAVSALLLLVLLVVLCASCQGQKKATLLPGDHENLMNGVSEKEACSQSVDTGSHGTDLAASSSHNGPLTSGTVLSDTVDTSPHPSEEMLSSQSEHRSSKCPQDRELPSIPCNDTLQVASDTTRVCGVSGEGTYEVLKDTALHDVTVEDSPYETVKELRKTGLKTSMPSPDLPPPAVPNGQVSPSSNTPDLCPLTNGAEYASIDLKKKSRYSIDVEPRPSAIEDPEDENPPPIPNKVLDENDNHNITLQNGELHLPLSGTPEIQNCGAPDGEVADLYSKVVKPEVQEAEHDYSSIGEIRGAVVESNSNELYATVRDVYSSPSPEQPPENTDFGYETIRIQKSAEDGGQQGNGATEPDYESVGELGLNKETSRL